MSSLSARLDTSLLERYFASGSRYHVYPGSDLYSSSFQEASYRAMAAGTNGDPIPRPVAVRVSAPPLDAVRKRKSSLLHPADETAKADSYLVRLYREIALASALFDRDRDVQRLHLCAGVHGYLSSGQIAETFDVLHRHLPLNSARYLERSITLDPASATPDDLAVLAKSGINHVIMQRLASERRPGVIGDRAVSAVVETIQHCRRNGSEQIEVDVSGHLSGHSLKEFGAELASLLEARPDRIMISSPKALANLPWISNSEPALEPDRQAPLEALQLQLELLENAGYVHLGMRCFVLPDNALTQAQRRGALYRNANGYTLCGDCDLVGIGVGALSRIGASFSQSSRDLASWEQAIDSGRLPVFRGITLDEEDQLRADVIEQLLCQGELRYAELEQRHMIDFREHFANELAGMEELVVEELAAFHPDGLIVTERGRLVPHVIAAHFDQYRFSHEANQRTRALSPA